MIEVKNLVKTYGDHVAVNGISFTAEPGRVYGLLGPNGAGKSTTMNVVTGCLAATSGSVTISGHDIFEEPEAAKACIGYLPELPPLYTDMTPREYLTFVAEAKKIKGTARGEQVRSVMEQTGLDDVADRLIKNLSKGYRQRVGIAQAMLGDPEIVILDEPTVGLDPKQILEIRALIRHLGETRTVILSSHILAEISAVCDHVMIISHGRLVANDTIGNLEAMANRFDRLHVTVRGDKETVLPLLTAMDDVLAVYEEATQDEGASAFEISLAKGKDVRDAIFFAMAERKMPILSMQYEQITLEDVFLALTDDRVVPDANGQMPTVEQILAGRGNAADDADEDAADEETESADGEDRAPDEAASGATENTEAYKPLFGDEEV